MCVLFDRYVVNSPVRYRTVPYRTIWNFNHKIPLTQGTNNVNVLCTYSMRTNLCSTCKSAVTKVLAGAQQILKQNCHDAVLL